MKLIRSVLACVMAAVGFLSVVGCAKEPEGNCRLIVKGRDITSGSGAMMYHAEGEEGYCSYVELPVVAIITELGATVKWQSEAQANVNFAGQDCVLDIEACTMYSEGSDFNWLTPAPGSTGTNRAWRSESRELYVRASRIQWILNRVDAVLRTDFDNQIIRIE